MEKTPTETINQTIEDGWREVSAILTKELADIGRSDHIVANLRAVALLHPDALPGIILLMRRMFYGGTMFAYGILVAISEDEVSEDEGIDAMERMGQELTRFGEDMRKGLK